MASNSEIQLQTRHHKTLILLFAGYYCSICDMQFSFKSKLDRHLKSDGHTFFANSIGMVNIGDSQSHGSLTNDDCLNQVVRKWKLHV
jgi:hypothetical protein